MQDDVRSTVRKLIQEHKNDTTKVMGNLAAKGLISDLNNDLNKLFIKSYEIMIQLDILSFLK